jgi:hypothetical protein
MTQPELDNVIPRPETRQSLAEHFQLEHGDTTPADIEIEDSILHHKGNTLEPEFNCPDCQYSITEVYPLRYVERVSDGTRFARDDTPTCTCEESTEEGNHFIEDRRYKSSTVTAIATAHCNWCDAKYRDVFKYQTSR